MRNTILLLSIVGLLGSAIEALAFFPSILSIPSQLIPNVLASILIITMPTLACVLAIIASIAAGRPHFGAWSILFIILATLAIIIPGAGFFVIVFGAFQGANGPAWLAVGNSLALFPILVFALTLIYATWLTPPNAQPTQPA